jgi:hypothetical protein
LDSSLHTVHFRIGYSNLAHFGLGYQLNGLFIRLEMMVSLTYFIQLEKQPEQLSGLVVSHGSQKM